MRATLKTKATEMSTTINPSLPAISIDLVRAALRAEGSFWSGKTADDLKAIEERYKRFLLLVQHFPNEDLAPTRDIDEAWHLHMLNPRAYAADCARIFGDLLDHDGGFGKDSPEQLEELKAIFEHTSKRWLDMFGHEYTTGREQHRVRCIRACRVACKVNVH